MTIKNSTLAPHVIKVCGIDIGELFFFNDIVVTEIKEGVHFTYENAQEYFKVIKDYFGSTKPFGIISNMVNSYSINLTDSPKFQKELNNLSAYGMVAYTNAGKLSAKVASDFCQKKDIAFDDLYEATNTVYNKVKNKTIPVD